MRLENARLREATSSFLDDTTPTRAAEPEAEPQAFGQGDGVDLPPEAARFTPISNVFKGSVAFAGIADAVSKAVADQVDRNTDRPLGGGKTAAFVQDKGQLGVGADVNSVDHDDVKQGQVGDCSLMASMAALAKQDPDAIKRLIKNEKYDADGKLMSCTVTLHKRDWMGRLKPHEIEVDCSKFPNKRANFGDDQGGVKELWPMILEKAFAQNNVDGGYAKLNKGVSVASAMEALTGKPASNVGTDRYSFDQLQKDLAAGKTVAFATAPAKDADGKPLPGKKVLAADQDGQSLVSNHAYAVVDSQVDASGQRWVKLYNPWGPGNTQPGDRAKLEQDGGWLKYEDAQRLLPSATIAR